MRNWRASVVLPLPGSPSMRYKRCAGSPPPRTASRPAMPVARRTCVVAGRSAWMVSGTREMQGGKDGEESVIASVIGTDKRGACYHKLHAGQAGSQGVHLRHPSLSRNHISCEIRIGGPL